METQIHNVTELEVRKVRRHTHERRAFYVRDIVVNSSYERRAFYVRDIVVRDDKGRKFQLTLFADERGTLALTGEGA
jgi:hypothetical protein